MTFLIGVVACVVGLPWAVWRLQVSARSFDGPPVLLARSEPTCHVHTLPVERRSA